MPPGAPGYGAPYGTPGGHGPYPPAQPQSDDSMWALMNYVGTIVVGFLAPLIIYFVKRNESRFVRFHAAQCLNFVITVLVYVLVGTVAVIGIVVPSANAEWIPGIVIGAVLGGITLFGLLITQFVFLILGIVRASRFEWYQMPKWICWPMIR